MKIPETRGMKPKYNFERMKVGDYQTYDAPLGSLLNCAKRWARINGKAWKFTCRTVDGKARIYRSA